MKLLPLSVLVFTAIISPVVGEAATEPGPKLIQSYTDVLTVIPQELTQTQASQWTEVKKKMVNVMLKENLVDTHAPAKFLAKVSEVAWWPGLTLFWEIPNQEGYHIRLFAGFTNDWKARLSVLNVGDEVIVEGTLSSAAFEKLWGNDCLSLCLSGSSFTRVPAEKAAPGDPGEAKKIKIISAVYGADGKFADVTARVDQAIRKKWGAISAKPESLEVDPAYGVAKSLIIVYEFQRQRHLYTMAEGGELDADLLIEAAKK